MAAPKEKWPLLKERYLEHMKVENYSRRTIGGAESHLRYFFQYLHQETKTRDLTELTPSDISAYQTWLCYAPAVTRDTPLGVASQHGRLGAVQGFFHYLFKQGALLYDPAASLEKPKVHRGLPRSILSPRQMLALLQAPNVKRRMGLRDRAILEFLYATGVRNEELVTLKLAGVEVESRQATVRGKGRKERVVPLGRIALTWLLKYLEDVRPLLARGHDPGLVFLSKSGRALTRSALWSVVSHHAKKAGLQGGIGPHALRHTCATHLLQAGADIRFIQVLLGHTSLSTTQVYTHVDITDLKKVHSAFHPREHS